MRKATLLLFLGIIPTLFTISTFGQCPTLSLTYPQEVPLNSMATLQASGCKGKVLWYLTDPKKGASVLYEGNSLLYPISQETTFYAACQLDDGTLCQSSATQAIVKVGTSVNVGIPPSITANISPTSYFPPTPTAAAFARYGDIPVSTHTGLIDEDIALYTVQSKDLSLGLSLSSHGSGNKVADVSSWVGLSMSLNAGGVISRTVQGTPDEGQGSPYSAGYYARSQAGSYFPSYSGGVYNNAIQWAIPRPSNYPSSPDCSGSPSQNFLDALDGKIDTEPDLFFFKVGSYSGKFMFDSLAVAHLFPEQDIKIQAVYSGNAATGSFDQFILTAPDGTKYYFGSTHGSTDFPQGSTAIEQTHTDATNPIPTAWYLTKIESVDSQSKIFLSYQSEQYAYFDLKQESLDYQNGWQGGFSPSQDFTKNRFLGVRLSNIYTSDKNTQVNFIADSLRKDVGEYTLGEYSLGFSQAKYLNEIQILNGTNGIKRFVFKHDYFQASEGNVLNSFKPLSLQNNPTFYQSDRKRLRLKSVQEQSWDRNTVIPAYQFKYDSTISFPRRLCYSQDHWGYYNGNEYIGSGVNNSLMHVENGDGITGIPTAYLSGLSWNSNRSSNPAYIGFGALIKIIYPTSGYTVFEYSNHQRGSFAPSLNIGGLRISSISNYDADGTRLTKKRFDYLSSGILYTRPTYFYTALQISFPCGSGGSCYPAGCPTGIASSSTLLPLSSTQGSHIGYQQVKVLEVNEVEATTNGYRLYTYNTDPPTIDVMNPSSYDDFGALRAYNYPLNPTRENYRQGTLALEEVLNSNNQLVNKTSYAYQYSSKVVPIPAMKVDNHTIGNIPAANRYYNFYRFKTGRSELRSKTTTNCKDDGTDCVVSTETYEYNSPTHFQMTRMSQSSSNGDSLINTYKYSFDYTINPSVSSLDAASNGIKQLRTKHVIVPIEELNLLKSNGNIVVMGGELTQYDATALKPSAKYLLEVTNPFLAQSSFVPSSIVSSGSTATFNKDSRYPAQANIAFLYNSFGNVAQIEQPQGSGLVRSFLWGYGGAFPIAEIKNATYASVQTALTSTVIDNLETSNSLSDAQIKSQLSPIWSIPNSLSSIYTYRPLRGVSTIMTSNQLNTSFFYDSLTRLSLTQDHENNKLTEHFYTYGTLNKITTKQYRLPTTGVLAPSSETNEMTSHEYFDGLGRLIQRVGEAHSPQGKDIIFSSPKYDSYGRLSNELTVFPTSNSTGAYVSNGMGLAQSFYGDATPYTTPTYEQSPLNRIRSSFGLGNAWRVAGKNMQSFDETAGTNVRNYTIDVSGNISLNGTYPANSLYRTRNIDEQGNTNIEVRDIQGRLIQRQQKSGTDTLTTYYINDALGRVLAIIQPQTYALGGSIAQNTTTWSNGVFFYQYDTRGRVYATHVPSGGFTYTVYDKADRAVLTQDAHQRTLNLWSFNKYDGLSRIVVSGELQATNRTALQNLFNSRTTISETFDATKETQLYYSDVTFPFAVDSSKAMQVNYYDNYTAWRKSAFDPFNSYYTNATGLQTGIRKRYTQNRKWLTEALYYDTKSRVKESQKEDILGNVERITKSYRFLGSVSSYQRLYSLGNGNGSLYYSNAYLYDGVERKKRNSLFMSFTPSIINLDSRIDYLYNEIGQLVTKKIQPERQYKLASMQKDTINRPPALSEINTQDIARKAVIISPGFSAVAYDSTLGITDTYLAEIDTTHADTLADALQTINYGYHIRGQQNCINCRNKQVYLDKENDLFAMKLDFEEDKRYYDGNISRQTWRNARIGNQQYKNFYDGVSRLTKSAYSGGISGSNYSLDTVRYDQNGNILQLKRHVIDNLSYTYNGNQLLKVADSGTNDGFKDGTNTDDDYGYWTNGALKYDRNKGIDSIVYHSYLKKVSRVKFVNGSAIDFYYDGTGKLLKRKLSTGDEWIYRDDLLMKNGKVYQINQDEGRVVYDSTAQKWVQEYDYRDIWGNLRLSFRDSLATPVNGIYAPPIIRQTADYDLLGYELATSLQGNNNYKFQQQERVKDFDLDIDLFQYRPSDSKIGRFWQIDPLSSQYPYNSPYALQENKFGRGVELEGLELGSFLSKVGDFMAGSNAAFTDNQVPFPTKIRETAAKGKNQAAFRAGEAFGDGLALMQAAGETLLGAGGDVGAAVVTVFSGGTAAPVTAPAAMVSTGLIVHGVAVGAKASKSISDRMTNSNSSGQHGSYTNTHESGKKYHGKGDKERAAESATEKAKKYNDPVKDTDWTPSANEREAFKDESRRLDTDKVGKTPGHRNPNNYNNRDSPGTKYRKQDGEN